MLDQCPFCQRKVILSESGVCPACHRETTAIQSDPGVAKELLTFDFETPLPGCCVYCGKEAIAPLNRYHPPTPKALYFVAMVVVTGCMLGIFFSSSDIPKRYAVAMLALLIFLAKKALTRNHGASTAQAYVPVCDPCVNLGESRKVAPEKVSGRTIEMSVAGAFAKAMKPK
jgi:hypothetical protein